jgi:5-methylcytosine-specific restriction endonuclease McrA
MQKVCAGYGCTTLVPLGTTRCPRCEAGKVDEGLTGANVVRRDQGLARQVKERDGWRCQECGSPHDLEVHHVDGNPRNNLLRNLRTLCQTCHDKADAKLRKGPAGSWRERREQLDHKGATT